MSTAATIWSKLLWDWFRVGVYVGLQSRDARDESAPTEELPELEFLDSVLADLRSGRRELVVHTNETVLYEIERERIGGR